MRVSLGVTSPLAATDRPCGIARACRDVSDNGRTTARPFSRRVTGCRGKRSENRERTQRATRPSRAREADSTRRSGLAAATLSRSASTPAPDESLEVRRDLARRFDEYRVPVSIEDHELGVGKL